MLEYFTYKKVKKHRDEKAEKQRLEKEKEEADKAKADSSPTSPKINVSSPDSAHAEGVPFLDDEDERFLERLASPEAVPNHDDDETPPPLPPRIKTPVIDFSETSSLASNGKPDGLSKDSEKGKPKAADEGTAAPAKPKKAFSFVTSLPRSFSLRRKPSEATRKKIEANQAGLAPTLEVPESEAEREQREMARVLGDLELAARDNTAFSLSRESAEMARRFTQVLRDLTAGVPTAYGDLVALIEDRDGAIARAYDKLPSGLKKLVAQLPDKLTSSLAPELLAVAAEAQGLATAEATEGGVKEAAKRLLTPQNMKELVTKPGAVAGLLRGIVNALKARWPAFMGTNVLWSVAVFLLLSMLWYCYKRGREVRLEQEEADRQAAKDPLAGKERVEELPDDPMLPGPSTPAEAARKDSPKTATAEQASTASAPSGK
ncbi:hypothetical protein F4780DRAFT_68129 [Xylariomycetidae sp. FL0641]|nr:hypothetical protein F4780DRAFT_68129 [Xylariomycetidae sp. FL0641]